MGSTTPSSETLTATGNGRSLVSSSGRHEAAARVLTDTDGNEYLVLRARFSALAAPNVSRPPLEDVLWTEEGQWQHIALDQGMNIVAVGTGQRERDSFEQIKRALRSKGILAGGGEGSRTPFFDSQFETVGNQTLGAWLKYWENEDRSPDVDENGRSREWHIGKLRSELRARGRLPGHHSDLALIPDASTGGASLDRWESFNNGDDPYYTWLAEHPDGYVVNTHRNPKPSYLQLHVATCKHISSPQEAGAYTERDYIKFCSTNRRALERWAEDEVGGQLGTGCYCLS
jgi:hypothetical protein